MHSKYLATIGSVLAAALLFPAVALLLPVGASASVKSMNVATTLPMKPITITATGTHDPEVLLYGARAKAFGISSLTLTNTCGRIEDVWIESKVTGPNPGYDLLQDAYVAARHTVELTFPTPLVLTPPRGNRISLVASSTSIPPLLPDVFVYDACVTVSGVGLQS